MKRSPMPARREPLPPGKPLTARQSPERTRGPVPHPREAPEGAPAAAQRVPAPRTPPRYTGPDADLVKILDIRDRGVCVICGLPGRLVTHHRKDRGMGGSKDPKINAPSNLLRVHPHENNRLEDAYPGYYHCGWKLRSLRLATVTPVLYWDGHWYELDDSGGRRRVPPPES